MAAPVLVKSDARLLHELVWDYGYRLKLRGDQLVAEPWKTSSSLPEEYRQWIKDHKQEVIAALKLTESREGCWICGEQGVAQIEAFYADMEGLVSRWHCPRHIPNTDLRRRLADAVARYRIAQQQPGNTPDYWLARAEVIALEVQQDLAETPGEW